MTLQTVVHPPSVLPVRFDPPHEETTCSADACSFCELSKGRDDLFVQLHGEPPHLAVPGVPDSLMAMLCAFPLGHQGGHLLLVPKGHYPSLARMRQQDDLALLRRSVTALLEAMFPQHWLFAFEHGTGALADRPIRCGGCHVDHAHGHVLVLDRAVRFDDLRAMTEEVLQGLGWDLPMQTHEGGDPFIHIGRFCGESPYLHIARLGKGQQALTYRQATPQQSIPSQLLRRLVATASGRPSPSYWNWKIALEHNLQRRLEQYGQAARSFKRAVYAFVSAGVT